MAPHVFAQIVDRTRGLRSVLLALRLDYGQAAYAVAGFPGLDATLPRSGKFAKSPTEQWAPTWLGVVLESLDEKLAPRLNIALVLQVHVNILPVRSKGQEEKTCAVCLQSTLHR